MGASISGKPWRKFGQDGFESYVARVAALEQVLGIHDLSRFTPA